MTQSEEIITLKGESEKALESVFLYNKNMEVNYHSSIEDREKIEIRLSHPNIAETQTFQMIFVIKGNVQISDSDSGLTCVEISSHQHNLLCLPFKNSRIRVNAAADDMICINISTAFLNRFLPKDHSAYQKLLIEIDQHPFALTKVNMQITPEINVILQKLSNSSKSAFADQLFLESKAIELFALQIEQFEQMQLNETPAKLKKMEMERMLEAREIVVNHTGDQLSLRTLAHLVGTNEFNLKRDFKALFGKTVYAYLNQHKMEKAKAMLLDEDITVAEISKKIGYKHPTHFTSAFKKYFGFLPNKIKTGKFSALLFLEEFISLLENFNLLVI